MPSLPGALVPWLVPFALLFVTQGPAVADWHQVGFPAHHPLDRKASFFTVPAAPDMEKPPPLFPGPAWEFRCYTG